MKHIFIVNSISGKGKALRSVNTIKEACEELKLDYEIRLTEYAGHTTKIAQEYSAKMMLPYTLLVAMVHC